MSKTMETIAPQGPVPQITPDDYATILRGLQLVRITLTSCQAKSSLEGVSDVFAQPEKLPIHVRRNASFEAEDDVVTVRHEYSLASRYRGKTLLSIKAEYSLVFRTVEQFTADFFEVFRRIALPMYTWPYLRELVGSMTSRMDLPKLLLPLVHTQ